MNDWQIENLRLRTAELSVAPSTVRKAGAPGTVRAAREALKSVDLGRFAVDSKSKFLEELDRETQTVRRRLPSGARHWGIARKVLNIFLRSCVQHRALSAALGLARLEFWLEIPLDSYTARGIHMCSGETLPRWKSVKSLSPEQSAAYQAAARRLAQRVGCRPVHLEACWWRTNTDHCKCIPRVR